MKRFMRVAYGLIILTAYPLSNSWAGWVFLNSGTTEYLSGVCFPGNVQTGYAVGGIGGSGTILKTINGGNIWESQPIGTADWLYSVHFPVNAQTGYVVGQDYSIGAIIRKTTNGGTNWFQQDPGNAQCLTDLPPWN